jgi:hypothetical protein
MTNLLDLTNAPDKGAVAQTNFERLDALLAGDATAVKVKYLLIQNPADSLYYKFAVTVVDGQITLAPQDDAGIA